MTSFGPIHKLIVHEVGDPYTPSSTSDFEDYEIIHPDECKSNGDSYDCGVGFNVEGCGARFSLHYTGTPVTEPGEYSIRAWAETYRGFDYTEHDGGIGMCDPGESIASVVESAERMAGKKL